MSEPTQPDYLNGNIEGWQADAKNYVAAGERAWASEPAWGIWQIPDTDVGLLPASMAGKRAIELGCGTAYVSCWMHRRGADVVAIDPTPNQLATARRLQQQHGLQFDIREGYAEAVPFPDASFDFAISEYGAALWADPYAWIPEAARLLKPGAMLTFLTNSPLMVMCAPDYDADGPVRRELLRPYFGMHKIVWPDYPKQTEFNLPHGEWVALLRDSGFAIERLVELKAPADASTRYPWADPDWAARWPSEDVWVAVRQS